MLYAIEWIRAQLTAIYDAVFGFLETLNLESINAFLTRSPALLALYILAGLVLMTTGFRSHKLLSSFIGGAGLGYLGWQISAAINPNLISGSILWTLAFAVIGLFVFYFLYMFNTMLGAFLVCFSVIRQLFAVSLQASALLSVVFTALYCMLLIRRCCIRTAIAGGALMGLIALDYFGSIMALGIFCVCVTGGMMLQNFRCKRYDEKKRAAREYRPNAPSPPSPEEIAAEIAQEEAEKAAMNGGGRHIAV